MLKIDTHVPLPARIDAGRPPLYPFKQMRVGDSVFYQGIDAIKLRNAAGVYKTHHKDWNYATRKENDGIRLWRTA